jgi:release factor glutamine methyltransferase
MSQTIESWLRAAEVTLHDAGVATARLDCLVLLEDVLNTNRTQILADARREITEVERRRLDELITKRARHIPLAYLRHTTEFYGREFYIDERVLEPRPESETMIDMLKSLGLPEDSTLADIGSGSGALGITAKLECPGLNVTLIEIDSGALAVSRRNVSLHNMTIQTLQADLLIATDEQFDVLLCNLPYVPDNFQVNTAALHEPKLAIFGGPDGLDVYRKLFQQISSREGSKPKLLTESLPPQHPKLLRIAADHGYGQADEQDFIQLFIPIID